MPTLKAFRRGSKESVTGPTISEAPDILHTMQHLSELVSSARAKFKPLPDFRLGQSVAIMFSISNAGHTWAPQRAHRRGPSR